MPRRKQNTKRSDSPSPEGNGRCSSQGSQCSTRTEEAEVPRKKRRAKKQRSPSHENSLRSCSQQSITITESEGDDASSVIGPYGRRAFTFELFLDLPAELRVKIWKFAITPQVITFLQDLQTPRFTPSPSRSRNTCLPLLSACQESRHEVLRVFPASQIWTGKIAGSGSHPLKFNYELDTIYLKMRSGTQLWTARNQRLIFKSFMKEAFRKLRNLSVDIDYYYSVFRRTDILEFRSLERLILHCMLPYTGGTPDQDELSIRIKKDVAWAKESDPEWAVPAVMFFLETPFSK